MEQTDAPSTVVALVPVQCSEIDMPSNPYTWCVCVCVCVSGIHSPLFVFFCHLPWCPEWSDASTLSPDLLTEVMLLCPSSPRIPTDIALKEGISSTLVLRDLHDPLETVTRLGPFALYREYFLEGVALSFVSSF